MSPEVKRFIISRNYSTIAGNERMRDFINVVVEKMLQKVELV